MGESETLHRSLKKVEKILLPSDPDPDLDPIPDPRDSLLVSSGRVEVALLRFDSSLNVAATGVEIRGTHQFLIDKIKANRAE